MKPVNSKNLLILTAFLIGSCSPPEKPSEAPLLEIAYEALFESTPTPAFLSPEESRQTIHVPDGYRLELVASEPMIEEPVTLAWDGNGRMYVAEMRTYVQDIDGTGTDLPLSRVMRLEDTDGDGKMDKSVVFIDSLVLPRMILPLDDRVLINETYTYNIHSYRDTDGDGTADEKVLVYENEEEDTRNLEHQRSGLIWNLDNWLYATRVPHRYRWVNDKLEVDSLYDFPHGQWGIAQDDQGRMFHSLAGGEVPALGFQLNPVYGTVELDDQFEGDFFATWPIMATPDVQGGAKRMRPDSTLNHFTASCGPAIFRGNNLPADLKGDLLICEPVGRLIRRAEVMNQEGKIVLKNVYDQKEFIASTDMNFRPVHTATGPDGCLYIVDMHRGIIQESNWTKEGTYLREVALRKGLDKNIGRGRIYRLVHEDFEPDAAQPEAAPKLLNEPTAQLVKYLSHPNGWWRDNAQKLIILRDDQSVVPALQAIATHQPTFWNKLAFWQERPEAITRVHALWTLEGLGALDKEILFEALRDEAPEVRKTAVWISDASLKEGDAEVREQLLSMKDDPSADVRIQLVSSLRFGKTDESKAVIQAMMEQHADHELLVAAAQKSLAEENEAVMQLKKKIALLNPGQKETILSGHQIFQQLCAACHGRGGKGIATGGNKQMPAPPLIGSARITGDSETLIKILLHGLTGPVDGETYPDVMPPMGHNDDEYIASVISYIRSDFGEGPTVVRPRHVAQVRQETEGRKAYWTLPELTSDQ